MQKYYTPNIEDFHVGFEYLAYLGTDKIEKEFYREDLLVENSDWSINVYGSDNYIQNTENLLFDGLIRVRGLSREDFENTGWKLSFEDTGKLWTIPKGYWTGADVYMKGGLVQELQISCTLIYIKLENGDIDYIFKGFIRNKSELEKVMEILKVKAV